MALELDQEQEQEQREQKLKLHPRANWTNANATEPASKIINTTIQSGVAGLETKRKPRLKPKPKPKPKPIRSDPIQSRRCHAMGITLI